MPNEKTQNWDPIHYVHLLQKEEEELSIQDHIQLKNYRNQLYAHLCYAGRSDFTSIISQFLNEPTNSNPNQFRENFVNLGSEFWNLLHDIEKVPTELSFFVLDYNFEKPFFNLLTTSIDASLDMIEAKEADSEMIMSEDEFKTLIGRFYYEHLFAESA